MPSAAPLLISLALALALALAPPSVGARTRHGGFLAARARFFVQDFLALDSPCTRGGPHDYPKCAPGLWCVGSAAPKCVRRSRVGGSCGTEYEVCGIDARCQSGACVQIPRMDSNYLPLNAACRADSKRCFPGLWCIAGRCRRLVPCGGFCGTSSRICRPGLTCKTEFKTGKKVCARDSGGSSQVRTKGEECFTGGVKCKVGLVCVKRVGDRCNIPGPAGKTCIDKLPGMCRVPSRIGENCGGEYSDCEVGRTCYISSEVQMTDVGQCRA